MHLGVTHSGAIVHFNYVKAFFFYIQKEPALVCYHAALKKTAFCVVNKIGSMWAGGHQNGNGT